MVFVDARRANDNRMTCEVQIHTSDPLVFQNFSFGTDDNDLHRDFPAGHGHSLGDHPDESAAAGNLHDGHGDGVYAGFVDQPDQFLNVGLDALV